MSGTSLAEIREAEAPPAIAAIYAALNNGIGIGQVNLIWRHAAALPGVLDWLWAQPRLRWLPAPQPQRAMVSRPPWIYRPPRALPHSRAALRSLNWWRFIIAAMRRTSRS